MTGVQTCALPISALSRGMMFCKCRTNERTGLPWWLSGKESTCSAGDVGFVTGSGRSPGEGKGALDIINSLIIAFNKLSYVSVLISDEHIADLK